MIVLITIIGIFSGFIIGYFYAKKEAHKNRAKLKIVSSKIVGVPGQPVLQINGDGDMTVLADIVQSHAEPPLKK